MDAYCGSGGVALASLFAGFEPRCAIDEDRDAVAAATWNLSSLPSGGKTATVLCGKVRDDLLAKLESRDAGEPSRLDENHVT